jgi:hypothetical protein
MDSLALTYPTCKLHAARLARNWGSAIAVLYFRVFVNVSAQWVAYIYTVGGIILISKFKKLNYFFMSRRVLEEGQSAGR